MKIEFTARHFHAPENLKDYTLTEVSRIQKYFDRITQCQVILSRENNTFTTEINLSMPKHRLNVKETTPKVTKSIDGAVEKMISRVTKITDKWKSH
jgi:ribosomal subunit interface protein